MKFKITSTTYLTLDYDSGEVLKQYPQLKDKVELTDTFCKQEEKQLEAIITLNSLEELTDLCDLIDEELILYKNYNYAENSNVKIYDDIYTIEIYDDWGGGNDLWHH